MAADPILDRIEAALGIKHSKEALAWAAERSTELRRDMEVFSEPYEGTFVCPVCRRTFSTAHPVYTAGDLETGKTLRLCSEQCAYGCPDNGAPRWEFHFRRPESPWRPWRR